MKHHKKQNISVVLAVYNEEAKLQKCLSSVKDIAHDIVVVDGGSTDQTLAIARTFTSRIIKTDNPPMFHINKQKAVDAATSDWILQIDADERLTPALRKEIVKTIDRMPKENGLWIPRKNYIAGKWMQYGGMYPDPVIRLFRKGTGTFPCKSVHEQIEITGKTGMLTEPMDHETYESWEEYMKKADAYTSLTAREMVDSGKGNNPITMIQYLFIKPIGRFIALYIRHKAIYDGWYGLLWAFFSGMHFPMAYIKFLEMDSEQ